VADPLWDDYLLALRRCEQAVKEVARATQETARQASLCADFVNKVVDHNGKELDETKSYVQPLTTIEI
jgi:hypothetical protein